MVLEIRKGQCYKITYPQKISYLDRVVDLDEENGTIVIEELVFPQPLVGFDDPFTVMIVGDGTLKQEIEFRKMESHLFEEVSVDYYIACRIAEELL